MQSRNLQTKRPRIVILAMPGTPAFVLYGLYEVLSGAGMVWPLVIGDGSSHQLLDVRIASSRSTARYEIDGTPISTLSLAQAISTDVIIAPDVIAPLDSAPHHLYPKHVALLRRAHNRGATIASVCNGALVLAEAGLLDGQEATTHWALADYFRKYYPDVRLRPERVLVRARGDPRVVTAGGVATCQDLALYLITLYCGAEEAVRVAKYFIIAAHVDGQLPYVSMRREFQAADSIIGKVQSWVADNYKTGHAVAAMAARSGLPLVHSRADFATPRATRRWIMCRHFASKRPSNCSRRRSCRSRPSEWRWDTPIPLPFAVCSSDCLV